MFALFVKSTAPDTLSIVAPLTTEPLAPRPRPRHPRLPDLITFPLLVLIICAEEVLTPLTELGVPLPRGPPPPLQTSTTMT